jgi:hypothetical protein
MPLTNLSHLLPWVRADILHSMVEFFKCDCSRATCSDNEVIDEQVCMCVMTIHIRASAKVFAIMTIACACTASFSHGNKLRPTAFPVRCLQVRSCRRPPQPLTHSRLTTCTRVALTLQWALLSRLCTKLATPRPLHSNCLVRFAKSPLNNRANRSSRRSTVITASGNGHKRHPQPAGRPPHPLCRRARCRGSPPHIPNGARMNRPIASAQPCHHLPPPVPDPLCLRPCRSWINSCTRPMPVFPEPWCLPRLPVAPQVPRTLPPPNGLAHPKLTSLHRHRSPSRETNGHRLDDFEAQDPRWRRLGNAHADDHLRESPVQEQQTNQQ